MDDDATESSACDTYLGSVRDIIEENLIPSTLIKYAFEKARTRHGGWKIYIS